MSRFIAKLVRETTLSLAARTRLWRQNHAAAGCVFVKFASGASGLARVRRQDDRYCASARAQAGFIISEGVFQIRLCI